MELKPIIPRIFYCSFLMICLVLLLSSGCAKQRTPAETRALLIGRWETVTDNDFEIEHVFTDSTVDSEEFGFAGDYAISDQDSISITFGGVTTTGRVSFPEGETTLFITTKDFRLRMRKIPDTSQ